MVASKIFRYGAMPSTCFRYRKHRSTSVPRIFQTVLGTSRQRRCRIVSVGMEKTTSS